MRGALAALRGLSPAVREDGSAGTPRRYPLAAGEVPPRTLLRTEPLHGVHGLYGRCSYDLFHRLWITLCGLRAPTRMLRAVQRKRTNAVPREK
ncbi:hypothetical protein GCM10010390_55500 [Streptomyces mordarskii]|uniref:Uncharacterized protein n=1 Tax=Streptomyces mordarskii TaxID=1226758 RepID=A0ABP3NMI9_9ACTN